MHGLPKWYKFLFGKGMRLLASILFFIFFIHSAVGQSKPEIIGHKDLSTAQDQPITILLTDLYVQENDKSPGKDPSKTDGEEGDKGHSKGGDKGNKGDPGKGHGNNGTMTYPEGYVLEIFKGKNYSFSGNTVTPAPGFTGVLAVVVRVKNEQHASPKYDLDITVIPVNEPPANNPPVITGQLPLTTPVNTPLKLKFSDLQVSDPDDQYPDGFSLQLIPGEDYSIQKTTVLPRTGFTGTLVVPVVVNDGKDHSEPFHLNIIVMASPQNTAPEITGQLPLSISKNQTITPVLSQLRVIDPDNNYPEDFTLNIFPGEHYSINQVTVIPEEGFTGDLFVNISVSDGTASSKVYGLKITVTPGANSKPVITGQAGIKIPEGQNLEIRLSHLVVEDNDNRYPEDFTLIVYGGADYLIDGNIIIPTPGFLGILTVKVIVNDGQTSSDPFDLKVTVIEKDKLEIIGQKTLEIPEDSSRVLMLTDLMVNDPGDTYPLGFSIHILKGEDYDVQNTLIKPHHNFFGNLLVPVTISKEGITSAPFSLLVIVRPVNDAPQLFNLEEDPIVVTGTGSWNVAEAIEIADVDDDYLLFAEIGFDPGNFNPGRDRLLFLATENIRAVFDPDTGILFLVGRAPIEEYQTLIRSIKYSHRASDSIQTAGSGKVYLKLNDGKDTSPVYERLLLRGSPIPLEIPSAFTPNNDQANDTWKITLPGQEEPLRTLIRVYDKRGVMVFETATVEPEWDGHCNGLPLPADVYFYTIELYFSNRKVNFNGIVSILR